MGVEIERKFLVKNDDWEDAPQFCYVVIDQGYLMQDDNYVLRIRTFGREGWLTIKSANSGMTRMEYEYPIRYSDARRLLNKCRTQITKERFTVVVGPTVPGDIVIGEQEWTIDVFSGENQGLVIAEIELESEDTKIELPSWLGEEVTFDDRYYNANLAECPYTSW
jgi:CYTH domain-containing protein